MRIESDSIVVTSFKNQSKVRSMIHSLARVSSKIIEVSFDYVFEIMKSESHGSLEGCSDIFQGKGILWYANVPQGHMNAILCWSLGLIWISL
jgi:hypothetical protein